MSTQPCSQSIPNDTCVTRIRDWQTWLLTSYTTITKTNIAVIFALSRDPEWRHRLQCADEDWLKKWKESVFGCKPRTNDKEREWTMKTFKSSVRGWMKFTCGRSFFDAASAYISAANVIFWGTVLPYQWLSPTLIIALREQFKKIAFN